jgi:hypothetical protein
MFSLQDLLGNQTGNEAVGQISQQIGADPNATNSAISMALPMIFGAMNQQANQRTDAFGTIVNMATENDGTILDDVAGYLTGSSAMGNMASGVLGNIFGNRQGQVTEQISQQSGLGIGQVANLLMMLAPLVMGYLGRKQTEQNLDAGGLADLIGGHQQQAQSSGNPMMDLVSGFLDSDRDGSSMDDIASLAAKFMQR